MGNDQAPIRSQPFDRSVREQRSRDQEPTNHTKGTRASHTQSQTPSSTTLNTPSQTPTGPGRYFDEFLTVVKVSFVA